MGAEKHPGGYGGGGGGGVGGGVGEREDCEGGGGREGRRLGPGERNQGWRRCRKMAVMVAEEHPGRVDQLNLQGAEEETHQKVVLHHPQ